MLVFCIVGFSGKRMRNVCCFDYYEKVEEYDKDVFIILGFLWCGVRFVGFEVIYLEKIWENKIERCEV